MLIRVTRACKKSLLLQNCSHTKLRYLIPTRRLAARVIGTPEASAPPTCVWAAAWRRRERRCSRWPAARVSTRRPGSGQRWTLPAGTPETSPWQRLLYRPSIRGPEIKRIHYQPLLTSVDSAAVIIVLVNVSLESQQDKELQKRSTAFIMYTSSVCGREKNVSVILLIPPGCISLYTL